ncbi:Vegetative incompatibility protein HET-E-1 [Balamuthia mandrillaris]
MYNHHHPHHALSGSSATMDLYNDSDSELSMCEASVGGSPLPSSLLSSLHAASSPSPSSTASSSSSEPEGGSHYADPVFRAVEGKVKQLEQAVGEFNQVLTLTSLNSYFNGVLSQLHQIAQETSKRLEEVATFYSWLKLHHALASSTSSGYFSILPEEISLYILSFLNVRELLEIARVSRYWRRLSEDDQLWFQLHKTRWRDGEAMRQHLRGYHPTISNNINEENTSDVDDINVESNGVSGGASFSSSSSSSSSSNNRTMSEGNTELVYAVRKQQARERKGGQKRKRRGWKDRFIDGHKLESNWKNGCYSTRVLREGSNQDNVYCIKFSESRVVTGSNDRTVKVVDLQSGELVHTLEGHTAEVRAIDFDETKLASGSRDRTVKIWDCNTGQCLLTMEEHTGPVKCIQMTDNIVMSGSEDATMKMFDLNSGKAVQTFAGHVWGVACLQFRDDYIVSGSRDRRVILWDRRLGYDTTSPTTNVRPFLKILEGHSNTVRCVAFNESHIVSGSWDNNIKVWDTTSGLLKNTLVGHSSRVLCLAFDEKKIVSGSVDNNIRVWQDYDSKPSSYSLSLHTAPIFYLKFDAYGIMSGSRDTSIVSWDFYSPNEYDICHTKNVLVSRCGSNGSNSSNGMGRALPLAVNSPFIFQQGSGTTATAASGSSFGSSASSPASFSMAATTNAPASYSFSILGHMNMNGSANGSGGGRGEGASNGRSTVSGSSSNRTTNSTTGGGGGSGSSLPSIDRMRE